KASLICLYGNNYKSNGKLRTTQEIMDDKDFKVVAGMLHVAKATAQIYTIDSFVAGAPIDHVQLANLLQVTKEKFEAIRNCSEQNKDHKLRSIRDELVVFSYNQIRLVLWLV
ncbi:unnamed protein product, partial [Porites lobata]